MMQQPGELTVKTCENCSKPHDASYASGRFCSVQCARRVAAARKWQLRRAAAAGSAAKTGEKSCLKVKAKIVKPQMSATIASKFKASTNSESVAQIRPLVSRHIPSSAPKDFPKRVPSPTAPSGSVVKSRVGTGFSMSQIHSSVRAGPPPDVLANGREKANGRKKANGREKANLVVQLGPQLPYPRLIPGTNKPKGTHNQLNAMQLGPLQMNACPVPETNIQKGDHQKQKPVVSPTSSVQSLPSGTVKILSCLHCESTTSPLDPKPLETGSPVSYTTVQIPQRSLVSPSSSVSAVSSSSSCSSHDDGSVGRIFLPKSKLMTASTAKPLSKTIAMPMASSHMGIPAADKMNAKSTFIDCYSNTHASQASIRIPQMVRGNSGSPNGQAPIWPTQTITVDPYLAIAVKALVTMKQSNWA